MFEKIKTHIKAVLGWIIAGLVITGIVFAFALWPNYKSQEELKVIKVTPYSYHYNDAQRVIAVIYPDPITTQTKIKGKVVETTKEHMALIITPQNDAATYDYVDNFCKVAAILEFAVYNGDSVAFELKRTEYMQEFKIEAVYWEGTRYQLSK